MPLSAPYPRRRGPCTPIPRDQGFTLVEVMVTAAVLLVSLTGMLTLQLVGIKAVQSTYYRGQATAIAYQISDSLRANRGSAQLPGTALSGAYDDLTLCRSGSRHPTDQRACSIGGQASIQSNGSTLSLDLSDWWSAIDLAGLPSWYAQVQRVSPGNAADRRFRIVVQWDDSHVEGETPDDASTKTSCTGATMPAQMEEVCLVTEL